MEIQTVLREGIGSFGLEAAPPPVSLHCKHSCVRRPSKLPRKEMVQSGVAGAESNGRASLTNPLGTWPV